MLLVVAFCIRRQWAAMRSVRRMGPRPWWRRCIPRRRRSGVAIMQQGGNAVDAAVAVGFALAVVYPEAGNIGGGGFLLFRRPDGEVHFLDYREKAPAKATANMYLDSQGNVVPDMSTIGYKADRRAGLGGRTGVRAEALGQADAEAGDGAGDPAGARRFCARLRRSQRLSRFPTGAVSRVASHLSARRRLLPARRRLQAAGTGQNAGAHRRQS